MATINRGWLKRQIEKGLMEARTAHNFSDDYAYDNATGFGRTEWMPARVVADYDNPQEREAGTLSISAYQLRSKSGMAYTTDREPGIITLTIHQNHRIDLRPVAK